MMTVSPVAGALGADVRGLDLSRPLNSEQVAAIRRALLNHCVLFFREQPVLSVEQHSRLTRYFGELEVTPFQREGHDPTLLMIEQYDARLSRNSQGANFHSDNTFRPYPPMGALLQAHVLPERGGDTCFASMYAAFDGLSARMRAYLDGMEAWHSLEQMKSRLASTTGTKLSIDLDLWPPIKHPVVAIHPETGRKLLNVNYNWTTHLDGVPRAESDTILHYLFEHIRRPEFQARIRWNVGDIAFWDNRSAQHCAVADYEGRRVMQRLAIAGSPAFAVMPTEMLETAIAAQ
ncbi:MAG: TauD/TfdA family dioxygenase [Sphingobium sp.]